MRDSLAIIEELGVPVKQIRASGGGSQEPAVAADSGRRVRQKVVTINAEEGPAYGVALLAAVGAGAFKNVAEACAATVKTTGQTKLAVTARKVYDKGFPVYQGLYRSLREDFEKIAELG